MNTYKKYCPNVFVAACDEKHIKGEVITLTTKYGKEHECIVHNYLGKRGEKHLYSITRADGKTYQDFMQAKADRIKGFKANAEKRSQEAYEARATEQERDFMSLGEPIKVGHHSERRHRKLFEKYDRQMRKSVDEQAKADEYARRAEYWEAKAQEINLSMPESLEYYEYALEAAKMQHEGYKSGRIEKEHAYSLTYARKRVKDLEAKLNIAKKLWQ